MRVVLVGSMRERGLLRERLRDASIQIVGEAPTLAAARAFDADAFLVAPNGRDSTDSYSSDSTEGVDRVESIDSADSVASSDSIDSVYREPLTRREIEVLDLLAEGLPNKAIAARLGISDQTVKFHVSSICGKLGAANRTDAVRRAVRRGIITL
jgi:DNA-binding CsgD family transcriptional regulator